MNLNSVRNLSVLFLLSIALSMMGCGGGGTDGDTPDGDSDVLDQDLTADCDLDKIDQPDGSDTTDNVDPDIPTICDENGVCCTGNKCCKGTNCWIVSEDVSEGDETTPDSDAEVLLECYSDDYCAENQWCDFPNKVCRADSLLEPYLFLQGNWKCLEDGASGNVNNVYPLTLTSWDETAETMEALFFDDLTLTFKVEGSSILLLSAIYEGGQWYNPMYDNALRQLSWDATQDGQYHWVFQLQVE